MLEFLKERDVFVCLSTGCGNSICFALVSLTSECLRGSLDPSLSHGIIGDNRFIRKGLSTDLVGELQQGVGSINAQRSLAL